MIVVDASAIVAIYLHEPERDSFLEKLTQTDALVMSPINAWEVLARAQSVHGTDGARAAEALLEALSISVPPADMTDVRAAIVAFEQFGPRTPARLNLGDCFAYALAMKLNAALLFKGDDFTKTDVLQA